MPSRFRIRQAVSLGPRTDGSQLSSYAASMPAQSPTMVSPVTVPHATDNVAFNDALQQHLQKLDQGEKDMFNAAYQNINPEDLFSRVKDFDRAYNEKSISRRCAEPVTRFIQVLEQFMRGVTIGIQSSPEISSLVVGAVRVIIDLAVKFVTFFNRLTEMMVCLTEHLEHLSEYAKAAKGSKLLQTTLANVYGDLLTFCSQVRSVFVDELGGERKWLSIKIFIRVQWEPFEAKFGAIDTSVRHHLQVLLHSVQALQINAIERGNREAESERQRVHEREKLNERKDFLTWISKYDCEKDHDTVFSKRHHDTGTWLLQEPKVLQWLDMHSSAVLWCHGKPGAGKSVLASILLEHVVTLHALDRRVAIAFAYIKYDFPDSHQPLNIVSALIKQLCWKKDAIPDDLLAFFHNYDGNARIPTLDTVIARFIHLVETDFDHAFLVIDALDECEQNYREQILDFVKQLTALVPTVKVFVTSRRETDIVEAFQLLGTPAIEIAAHNVEADINSFVADRVKYLLETKKLKIRNASLKEKIIKTLTTQADGMFLWVNLQLENLCRQRSDRDIERELNSLPEGLNATYERIVKQINLQPKALRCLAQRALMWVVYAIRPLRYGELEEAIAIEETCATRDELNKYPIEVILESCSNLLTNEHDRIKPIHFSVQEYLTNVARSATDLLDFARCLEYNNAHTQIARSCMSYLMLDCIAKGPCKDRVEMLSRTYDNRLAVYASHFFDTHIHRVTQITPELEQTLISLLYSENRALSAILQLRQGDPTRSFYYSRSAFYVHSWPVNTSTLIYSTALFDLPYLQTVNTKWKTLKIPKYTLHQASFNGSIDAICRIMRLRNDINETDENGNTPLSYAMKKDRTKVVRLLLESGADFSLPNNKALQRASFNGSPEIVQILLEFGADVNAQGGNYHTTLQAAACKKSTEIVRILLNHGAEVNVQGGKYHTALQAAAYSSSNEIIQILLDKGSEVNAQGGFFYTALQAAAYGGSTEIIQILLNHGAEVNVQGGKFYTALQAAAYGGSTEIIQILLDHGAEVNVQGGEYYTALQAAAYREWTEIVQILLDHGAEVNAQGGEFHTALQAASYTGSTEIIQILLDHGADVNAQGGYYGTALQAAVYGGSTETIQILLDHGSDVNAQGGYYGTALQAAVCQNSTEIIQILLNHSCEVNAQGGFYGTALQAASWAGSISILRILLDKGAKVNAQGGHYGTALQTAAERDDDLIVKLLLESGAEVNATGLHPNYRNLTPLALARMRGRSDVVVKLLLDEGGVDLRKPEAIVADD